MDYGIPSIRLFFKLGDGFFPGEGVGGPSSLLLLLLLLSAFLLLLLLVVVEGVGMGNSFEGVGSGSFVK